MGIGGLPKGRVVEIYGPESSGKTTLTLQVIAEAQKLGGTAAFVDAEHALDPSYAEKLGVDVDELLVSQPDTGEQALEITDMLVRSGAVDIVVVDSVAALTPKAEIEGEMGDSHMGLQARLMSQALRKLTGNIQRSNTMVVFINQIRMKIGVMFGSPETTTGGNALKFYSSVRLDIRRIGAIKKGDEVIGNQTRVKVVKNKVSPPFKQAEFEILYGQGISRMGEVIDLGVQHGIVDKAGSWYSYGDDRIGQGKENVREFLKNNPEMAEEIEGKIRAKLLPSKPSHDMRGEARGQEADVGAACGRCPVPASMPQGRALMTCTKKSAIFSPHEEEDRFSSPIEARKKAMDFLARREYGQTELIRKLADKGFERDVAAQAVTQLTDEGLQSDQRFAESFVQSRINQGKGPVRIRLDLGQRGISESTIELASRKLTRTGARWPGSSASKSSADSAPSTSRKRPARCGFSSTAVSSKTTFRRVGAGDVNLNPVSQTPYLRQINGLTPFHR